MKVLITTEFYLPLRCGVTTAVLNERRALEADGHDVRILTISGDHKSSYKDGVYYIKNNFPQLYKDSYASIALFDPLVKDILEWKPDIVHSQCEFFTMFFARKISKKLGIPLVHTCHTDFNSYMVHFTSNEHLWEWATTTFIPKLLKGVDYIVCPTSKIYDLLRSYGIMTPMSIIPVGLDLGMLMQKPSDDERKALRRSFSFADDETVFVSVCRLSEEKNVGESIEHFRSLLRVRPAVKLLIVGDGTDRQRLETMVSDLGIQDRVKFTGNVPMDDVWKYFKVGDIYISSSMSEIQGLTYIEALAGSLPIVCRKDHALDQSLIEGVNGFSFSTDKEFLEKATPLVDDPDLRKRIGENARKSVDKYSLAHFAKSLERVFGEAGEIARHRLDEDE